MQRSFGNIEENKLVGKRMKKALIVTHVSGFLIKFCMNDVEILQKMGYEVHYASNRNEKGYLYEETQLSEHNIIFHHVDIVKSPYMFRMNYHALKQLIQIVNEEDIQLIHCHTPVGGMLGRLAGRFCSLEKKPKVIYTAHGFHFFKGAPLLNNTIFYTVEKLLAFFTDTLVVINEEDYRSARKLHLKRGGRVYKMPGVGIDRQKFLPAEEEEKRSIRKKFQIPQDAFLVLSVGELNENKNHKVILDVIQKIKKREEETGRRENIYYGICGDGFFRDEIRDYARKLGISSKVFFWGYCSEIRQYYAMADLTIFPSIREGLGMAGIESLAMGIPVLAADNRGTREYMVNGKNGFVYDHKDADGFLRGIYSIKNMDPEDLQQMKKYCQGSVEKFDTKYARQILEKVYKDTERAMQK